MNFDMNTVWSRGIELVRDNFQLLIVIAGVFLLLPTLAAYLLIPDLQAFMDPTADQDVLAAKMLEMIGPILGFGVFSMVFQFAGYSAMVALMGDARPTVGQALGAGFKVVPSLFAVLIVFFILYIVGATIVTLPFAIIAGAAGIPAIAFVSVFLILLFVVWILTRMSMCMPVLVLEGTLNPIKAVARSFKLTGPNQWRIMLFWGVLFVIYMVIALLFAGMFGLVGALLGGGTATMIVTGLANGMMGMAVGILVCGLTVAMFGQLSGISTAAIEDTFE